MPDLLILGPASGPTLLLAHGAGAPMDSEWMNAFAQLLATHSIRTARFEFAYMAARRSGQTKPPPKAEKLIGEFQAAIAALAAPGKLVIGGKSMGGRVASLVAAQQPAQIAGLVCLGYPFHPPEKPDQLRTEHLKDLALPTLICQGTRDPFGTRDEVPGYGIDARIELHWLEDGDHDFAARKKISGRTRADNLNEAAGTVAEFIRGLL